MPNEELVYPGAPLGVLARGTRVSVRSWVEGCWIPGFEIVGIVIEDDDILGYRVLRVGESAALRAWVPPNDVLPVRRLAA